MPHDNQDVGEARQLGEERLVSLDGEVRDVRKRLDLQWCQVMTLHEKLPNTCDRTLAGSALLRRKRAGACSLAARMRLQRLRG